MIQSFPNSFAASLVSALIAGLHTQHTLRLHCALSRELLCTPWTGSAAVQDATMTNVPSQPELDMCDGHFRGLPWGALAPLSSCDADKGRQRRYHVPCDKELPKARQGSTVTCTYEEAPHVFQKNQRSSVGILMAVRGRSPRYSEALPYLKLAVRLIGSFINLIIPGIAQSPSNWLYDLLNIVPVDRILNDKAQGHVELGTHSRLVLAESCARQFTHVRHTHVLYTAWAHGKICALFNASTVL